MVWTIFEVIVNFFQGFIIQQFMESRLHISRKHKLHDVLCILTVGLYSSLALIVTVPLPDATIFLIPLIYRHGLSQTIHGMHHFFGQLCLLYCFYPLYR